MIEIKQKILKLVINPDKIEGQSIFSPRMDDNFVTCSCGSCLMYFVKKYGVIAETNYYGIMHNRNNRTFNCRTTCLMCYCSECGSFIDDYSKWIYPEDDLVYVFDELNMSEKIEIDYCLRQFDQKGDFKENLVLSELKAMKKALIDYEIKYPFKEKKDSETIKEHKCVLTNESCSIRVCCVKCKSKNVKSLIPETEEVDNYKCMDCGVKFNEFNGELLDDKINFENF